MTDFDVPASITPLDAEATEGTADGLTLCMSVGAGAVHQSPSASEDSPRLLLTLDKAHCCSEC